MTAPSGTTGGPATTGGRATGTPATGTTATGTTATGRIAATTRAATTGGLAPTARPGPVPSARVHPGGRTARATRTATTVAGTTAPGTTASSAGTVRRAGVPGLAASRRPARAGPAGRKPQGTLTGQRGPRDIPVAEVPQVRGGTQDTADISDISSQANGLRVGPLFLARTATRSAGCGRLALAVDGLCDRNSLPDSTKSVPLRTALD